MNAKGEGKTITCRHCKNTVPDPGYNRTGCCKYCNHEVGEWVTSSLTPEDHAVIEANAKRWAAKTHLIPDHVWLQIREIWNRPCSCGYCEESATGKRRR